MPGAASGSSAMSPLKPCPFCTVSRLVPSWAISASSPAWEEADSPSTATIAATPIAIPSADRPARSLRVRRPTLASRPRSAGRSRAAAGAAGAVAVMGFLRARDQPGRVWRPDRGREPAARRRNWWCRR